MSTLKPLMRQNFLEYASYVIVDRAIPDLRDGLKPVQRRILHTLYQMHDGKFHKVANVIGETMKLHPHGDAAIGDALVVIANKDYLIERQGNFGSPLTGHRAAAARYIECRLTPLALDTLFNPDLTEFLPSYDGRREEPVFLPSKLPLALLLGPEGIAVGMATKILPHNLIELLEGQIAILEKRQVTLFPDFGSAALVDVSDYEDGKGKVRVRARLEERDEKTIVIRELPFGTTTETLIASIEAAAQKGKVKIGSIDDFTTDSVEIQLSLPRGVYSAEVIPQLYAYTDCEVSISSNPVVIRDGMPVVLGVAEMLEVLTERLREIIRAELEHELVTLQDRQHWLTLEQIFIEQRVYKLIEKAKTEESVRAAVWGGMHEFEILFVRPMIEDDVARLLEIRIRRISAYDIERNRKQLDDISRQIRAVKAKLRSLTKTTTDYLRSLVQKYRDQFPRRSEVRSFEVVDKKAVARQDIKLAYDRESGFFGSQVKGSEFAMSVSEYDRVLLVSDDGSYRIMAPPEKALISGKLLHCSVFDPEAGIQFTVIYRDAERICFGKRVHIQRFITDKEYHLTKEGKVDYLLPGNAVGKLELKFVPQKRQRVTETTFDLAAIELMGVGARGNRLAPKPVGRLKLVRE
ncbi:MAG: DNA topoisomerase IV subunit A [Planctomycetota bacterium]